MDREEDKDAVERGKKDDLEPERKMMEERDCSTCKNFPGPCCRCPGCSLHYSNWEPKEHTCKFCHKKLDSDREFCDNLCAEEYIEHMEDKEYREAMKNE